MSEQLATWIWMGAAGYALLGLLAAAVLLLGGLRAIDAAAADSPLHFKLLILPGLVALWPLMARRLAGWRPPEDRANGEVRP